MILNVNYVVQSSILPYNRVGQQCNFSSFMRQNNSCTLIGTKPNKTATAMESPSLPQSLYRCDHKNMSADIKKTRYSVPIPGSAKQAAAKTNILAARHRQDFAKIRQL